jgi:hypothetical protein
MRTHFENNSRIRSQRIAELKDKTADLERRLSDARISLERELSQSGTAHDIGAGSAGGPGRAAELPYWTLDDADGEHFSPGRPAVSWAADPDRAGPYPSGRYRAACDDRAADHDDAGSADEDASGQRTDTFVSNGRRSSYRRSFWHGRKVLLAAALVAALVTGLIVKLSGSGASWPSSVATVQSQAARACENPDVKSEPGQVNFACAPATRQILWVFALMTSGNNPDFADAKTGRLGLEPITPAQGGEVAWSLNLHHPYDPTAAIDSLAVAARAINNIIGGATVTSANGNTVVQPGLESAGANCVRYTGSAALVARKGFPSLCARPLTSPAGEGALVADVYQKWVVGAAPGTAQDSAVLFENADDPGNAQVQAILRNLPNNRLLA